MYDWATTLYTRNWHIVTDYTSSEEIHRIKNGMGLVQKQTYRLTEPNPGPTNGPTNKPTDFESIDLSQRRQEYTTERLPGAARGGERERRAAWSVPWRGGRASPRAPCSAGRPLPRAVVGVLLLLRDRCCPQTGKMKPQRADRRGGGGAAATGPGPASAPAALPSPPVTQLGARRTVWGPRGANSEGPNLPLETKACLTSRLCMAWVYVCV